MSFSPSTKTGKKVYTSTGATHITACLGKARKAAFESYCRRHGIPMSTMVCQMIDYCLAPKQD